MNRLTFCLAVIGLACAQFPEQTRIWTGPLAPHQIGQQPPDTPEVAAAKAQHLKAHSDVLAVLPILPPEIRYQMHGIVNPQPIPSNFVQNPIVPEVRHVVPPVAQPIHTSPQFMQFAEEIPRSPIGEVPEVHAARIAHLKAVQDAKAVLPPLMNAHDSLKSFQVPVPVSVPVQPIPSFQNQIVQDTPEVLAAKAAHFAAVAAAGK